MTQLRKLILSCLVLTLSLTGFATAGTVSPVQSSARPFRLNVVGPVMIGDSDERSKDFLTKQFNVLKNAASSTMKEGRDNTPESKRGQNKTYLVDPSRIRLEQDYDVRAYFIDEGTDNANSFGFFTSDYDPGQGIQSTDAKLIFPNTASSASLSGKSKDKRTNDLPLLPGDFVELGLLKSGTHINPFLIENGASGGTNVYSPFANKNPDGFNHFAFLSMVALKDSPYLILAVEDHFGGGDKDYNDLLIALDVGVRNVAAITGSTVPAPPAFLGAIAFAGFFGFRRLRKQLGSGSASC